MTSKGRARSREYDYRPNLNTSQFSQGTLFSGGPRSGKGHRGYTPERLAEVKEAVQVVGAKSPASVRQDPGIEKGNNRVSALRVHEAIARSTVPMDALPKPLKVKVLGPDQRGLGSDSGRYTTLGRYETKPLGARLVGTGQITIRDRAVEPEEAAKRYGVKSYGRQKPGALIHELGHAFHDNIAGGIPAHTYEAVGNAEGIADSYQAIHFRDRRGNRVTPDEYPSLGKTRQDQLNFRAGYNASRADRERLRNDIGAALGAARRQPAIPGIADQWSKETSHPHFKSVLNERHQEQAANAAQDRRNWRQGKYG